MAAPIHPMSPDLDLIELRPPIAGFDTFISAWLCHCGPTFLVDVGPAVTAPDLLAALAERGVKRLDAIYLTHIHIDHAGAIGDLSEAFPDTPIVVHPKGISHLEAPTRLWEGTLKTLADTARAYGPFKPVPAGRCVPADGDLPGPLTALATPGHAPHHISFLGEMGMFVGEAGGVRLELPDGDVYMRPATPPRFFPEVYLNSLALAAAQGPRRLFYGHFGMTADTSWLERHEEQIHLWMEVVAAQWRERGREANDAVVEACMAHLLAEDPHLSPFRRLSSPVRGRERGFLRNSVLGMLGELAARQAP